MIEIVYVRLKAKHILTSLYDYKRSTETKKMLVFIFDHLIAQPNTY